MKEIDKPNTDAMRAEHVSQISHTTARRKIEVKVALLEFWGRENVPWKRDAQGKFLFDQNGEKILEYVPTSKNEVRRWKVSNNSPGIIAEALEAMLKQQLIEPDHMDSFDSYDASALTPGGIQRIRDKEERARYVTLKQNLNRALDAIKIGQKRQLESENKSTLLSDLQQQIKVMDLQRASAALQSLADRKELRDSKVAWKDEKEKYERKEKELKEILASRDEKIASLEAKISDLVKERQNVLGLKETGGTPREA